MGANRALAALQARAARVGGPNIAKPSSDGTKTETVSQIVLFSFYDVLTQSEKGLKLANAVVDQALAWIQKYRQSFIDQAAAQDPQLKLKMVQVRTLISLLKECRQGLVSPGSGASLYEQLVEPKFVQKTQQFYEKQHQRLFKLRIFDYIDTVDRIFTYEDSLSEKLMFNLSFSLNNSCIYEQMIKASSDEILKSGLPSLLNERKYKQLVLLYSYLHDVELLA